MEIIRPSASARPWRVMLRALARTAACALLLVLAAGPATAGEAVPVRIGVLAFLGDEAASDSWEPVLRHLRARLPGHAVSLQRYDHLGLQQAVAAGTVDFVITNPGHYIELEAGFGASRMLTLDSGRVPSAERALGSAVVVLRERADLHALADLRGRRLAVVGKEGFGGYQLVWGELAALGIDPERDLAALASVGLPMDRVLDAVARGEADAGVVRACMIESRPEWQARFRVVGARTEPDFPCASSTPLYPDWPFARLRQTPPELARTVAIALLGMERGRDGLAWAVPADYQVVHELFRRLQIGPYATLPLPTLMMLAERYWPWVAAFAALIVAWILYTVHVERLVEARTAALRAAMDERERMAARMRDGQEQADHLARLSVLGELSGTLAHELNQPLATIANYAHSLVRRLDNGRLTDDALREAAGEIAAQAERAGGILGRIRGFARKRSAPRAPVAPAALVDEAVALFRGMLAGAPSVAVVDALPPGVRVEADALQIQQIVLNLLKNAYDAGRGLPPERQRLTVRLTADAGSVRIAVEDRGAGLDAPTRGRLFEPFFTTKPDGLGLGLPICRSIAEAHGGRLDAAPAADGPGSVFTLSLPAVAAPATPTSLLPDHDASR